MTTYENDHQSEIPETKKGSGRLRIWTAAGLAVGLMAGTGLSLTAASPFTAGASVDSEMEDARQATRNDIRDGHGRNFGTEGHPHRHGLKGRPRLAGHRGEGMRAELLEAAATFLELSPEELREDLQAGSTLSTIAQEQGKSRDDLIAALLAEAIDTATARLNEFIPRLVDGELRPRRNS